MAKLFKNNLLEHINLVCAMDLNYSIMSRTMKLLLSKWFVLRRQISYKNIFFHAVFSESVGSLMFPSKMDLFSRQWSWLLSISYLPLYQVFIQVYTLYP